MVTVPCCLSRYVRTNRSSAHRAHTGGGVVAGGVPELVGELVAGLLVAGDDADGVVAATAGPAMVGWRTAGGTGGPA